MLADVVSDSQQMTRLVEQEIILHTGELVRLQCKALDSRNPGACAPACLMMRVRSSSSHAFSPGVTFKASRCSISGRKSTSKVGQLAQRRDRVDTVKVLESILRGQERCPRSKKH